MNLTQRVGLSLLAASVIGAGAFHLGRTTGRTDDGPASTTAAPAGGTGTDRKILYWHDPMVPGPRFDKPGKSPFMDMQLVPMYAQGDAGAGGVQVSPALQQNLGIRLAVVRRAQVSSAFDAVGAVQFDERLNVAVQSRVAGYVERLAVRAPMERVRKGQALATIFAPDWLAPQSELLALQRAGAAPEFVAAARERLKALSIPADLVQQSEKTGIAQARYVLSAPAAGVVAELSVREGVAVSPGMTLFRIAGLEKVWAVAEVPESQAVRLVRGQKVKATLQADASQSFSGTLDEILPEVSVATRTLKARFEVDNQAGRLTPGMLLRLEIAGAPSVQLLVPSEAVIRTGRRAVVIAQRADGGFEPRDVTLGADRGDDSEVVAGLQEGDKVVASGQFLIDSEARLRSVLGNLAPAAAPAGGPPQGAVPAMPAMASSTVVHRGEGTVEKIEPASITLSHGPIATLKWPAMTMGFARKSPGDFADIRQGDRVRFEFEEGGPMGYELRSVERLQPAGKP